MTEELINWGGKREISSAPLMDRIYNFLIEKKDITDQTIQELSDEFELSYNYAKKVIQIFLSGDYYLNVISEY